MSSMLSGAQDNWRWCKKCQSLFYGCSNGMQSVCPAGGTHDSSGSGNYVLYCGQSSPYGGQSGWSWCNQCGVLFYPNATNHCPKTGGAHVADATANYFLCSGDEPDRLAADKPLNSDATLRSCNKHYAMVVQSDGNLVVYGPSGVVWASNTGGRPHASNALVMQSDGNVVLYGPSGHNGVIWAANSGGKGHGQTLVMQDDGNLVAYAQDGHAIWASNTGGRDDLPGQDEWRWCNKCGVLHFNGGGQAGVCAAGGGHVTSGSGKYGVTYAKADIPLTAAMPGTLRFVTSGGPVFIQVKKSRKFYDVTGGSTADCANLEQWDFNGRPNQQFRFDGNGDGTYTIVPMSVASINKNFDISGASMNNGAPLIQYAHSGNPNQRFQVRGRADGWFSIFALHSQQSLGIAGGATNAGAQVVQWPWDALEDKAVRFIAVSDMPTAGSSIILTNFGQGLPLGATAADQPHLTPSLGPADAAWTLVSAGGGDFYLKNIYGKQIGSRQDGSVYITTNADTWERWFIEPTGDGTVLLRSAQWGLHLGGRPDGSLYTSTNALAWESWYCTPAALGTHYDVPARNGSYDWSRSLALPEAGRGIVSFTATATNDVHVAISPQGATVNPMYEIVIGGWGNTRSVIRRSSQGAEVAAVQAALTSPGGANQLWVAIDKTTGTLRVGRGAAGEDVFLSYTDPQFLANAQQVTFASWDKPISYTDISAAAVQPYIETQCKLIVDYDANKQPHSVFEVVLIPRSATGDAIPGCQVKVFASSAVTANREDSGTQQSQTVDAQNPITLTASPMGRCRFTITPPTDQLVVPLLKAQSAAMASGQWAIFAVDSGLHQQLAQLTPGQILSTPKGKPGPLLAQNQSSDATALAGAVSQLMRPCLATTFAEGAGGGAMSFAAEDAEPGPQAAALLSPVKAGRSTAGGVVPGVYQVEPHLPIRRVLSRPAQGKVPAPASPAAPAVAAAENQPAAFGLLGELESIGSAIGGAASQAGSAIGGVASQAGSAIGGVASQAGSALSGTATTLAQRASNAASSAAAAVASQSRGAIGSATQLLDTAGAAAQILIQNADVAVLRPAATFAASTVASAQQLAIVSDVEHGLVVMALAVENGVPTLVKTVIEDVESAAAVVVSFVKRVGLAIKSVIDFLAMLFDWDAILATQAKLQQALDQRVSNFPTTIAQQRASLAGWFSGLQAQIAGLSAGGAVASKPSGAARDLASLGGNFGFLLDKVESYLVNHLGMPANLGMGAVGELFTTLANTVGNEITAFATVFANSSIGAALTNPQAILSLGPPALLSLIQPVAAEALKVLQAAVDAVLAFAPSVVSVVKAVLQQRIAIPILTDLIELIVFHNKQQLSLESLLTLMAAALYHVFDTLATEGPLSFADPTTAVDPMPMVFMALGIICNFFPAMFAGACAIFTDGKAASDVVGFVAALGGLLGGFATIPAWVPANSFLLVEQWLNWSLNTVASVLGMLDAASEFAPPVKKAIAVISGACGAGMIITAVVSDSLAINKGHGDAGLAGLDLAAQICGATNNFVPLLPEGKPQMILAAAANTAAMLTGLAAITYTSGHQDKQLGC